MAATIPPHMALLQSPERKVLLSRLCRFLTIQGSQSCSSEGGGRKLPDFDAGEIEWSKWRKMDSRSLGLSAKMVPNHSWTVLRMLQAAGHEAYFVGGCVRDLLLKKVPKDFDIATTAGLKQVKRIFNRAIIIGKRFPICKVFHKDCSVEVSSFETASQKCKGKKIAFSQMPKGCDRMDFARFKNCMKRDFTVNSLYFDPARNVIFDYTNALKDIRSKKLRTITVAKLSFKEDEARILRGLRLAARLNLMISKEAEEAIYSLSKSVANLSTGRITLEMNYMFSYGAAEPSILLLEKYKLLQILLPFHAAYFSEQERNKFDLGSTMLSKLLFNMDRLISCEQPGTEVLWVAIMAFHKALFSNPHHPVVVLTFASLLYHGTWEESLEFARKNASTAKIFVPEMLDDSGQLSDDELVDKVTHLEKQMEESANFLVSKDHLSDAMARFPESPWSDLVFVAKKTPQRIKEIVSILRTAGITSLKCNRNRNTEIRSGLVTAGDVSETRLVIGRIILDTLVDDDEALLSGKTRDALIKPSAKGAEDVKKKPLSPSSFRSKASRDRDTEVPLPRSTKGGDVRSSKKRKAASDKESESECDRPRLSHLFR